MNEKNFDWDDVRLFLAVARGGGLSPAARATGKSAPTLGRRMLTLEKAVGAELFERLPRGYVLTGEGARLLAEAEALEARILPLVPGEAGPTLVKISAGAWMTQLLCTEVSRIAGPGDGVILRFIAADHRLDIARREAVIGLRNARPSEVGLAGRRVGEVRFAGYAVAKTVEGWIRPQGETPSAIWVREQTGGHLEVTTPRNALDLALAGAGRVVLPTCLGARTDGLVQVTPEVPELRHDQWLVSHHEERFTPAVRRVIDRLAEVLRDIHSG